MAPLDEHQQPIGNAAEPGASRNQVVVHARHATGEAQALGGVSGGAGGGGAGGALDRFLHRLRNHSEAERLIHDALEHLAAELAPRWSTAWLADELRPGLRRVLSHGLPEDSALPEVLPEALAATFPTHMDPGATSGAGMPAQLLSVPEARDGGAEMEEVRRLDAQLLVTLPGGHLVQGALLLGPRAGGRAYDEAARHLLRRMGGELGRALAAAGRTPAALLPIDSRVKSPGYFVARLEEELARAERFKRALTVIWVTVDAPPGLSDRADKADKADKDGDKGVGALVDTIGSWLGTTLRVMDTIGKRPDRAMVAVLPETTRQGAELLKTRLDTLASEQSFGLPRQLRSRLRLRVGMAGYPEDGVSSRFLLLAAERDANETRGRAADGEDGGTLTGSDGFKYHEALHGPTEKVPVAASHRMREVLELAQRVANSKLTVLVTGETGVGKERIAEFIHHNSDRRDKPEVRLNCGAIPDTMIEAEFFGFERGSFTGAVRSTRGKFELADGGTLFLDEIGELSMAMQVKLLRVLDEQRFYRLGAAQPCQVDVRVIAITNRDLAAEVVGGRFREDLFYRLNVVTIKIPPLRERPEDIPPLVDRLIVEFSARSGLPPRKLALEAYDLLYSYPWRGNVRELRNVIERSVVVSKGGYITGDDLIRAVPDLANAKTSLMRPPPRPVASHVQALPTRSSLGRQREQGVLELIRRRPDIGLQEILREVGASKSTGIRLVNELIRARAGGAARSRKALALPARRAARRLGPPQNALQPPAGRGNLPPTFRKQRSHHIPLSARGDTLRGMRNTGATLLLALISMVPVAGCGDSNRGNNTATCPKGCMNCRADKSCGDCDPARKSTCMSDTVITCNEDGTLGEHKFCDSANGEHCMNGTCLTPCDVAAATHSYIGCDYWPVPLLNAQLDEMFDFAVVVANPVSGVEGVPGPSANVKVVRADPNGGPFPVCVPDGNPDNPSPETVVQITTVESGKMKVLKLPWIYEVAGIQSNGMGGGEGTIQQPGGAYHLCSSMPVTVYQFNPLQFEKAPQNGRCPNNADFNPPCHSYTNDASTLLPTSTLGKEYIVASRGGSALQVTPFGMPPRAPTVTPGFFTIVGTEDDTTVTINYTGASDQQPAGGSDTVVIGRGEVYQAVSARPRWDPKFPNKAPCIRGDMDSSGVYCDLGPLYDLTGTHIVASKPVALYGGHSCSFVPYNRWACDHLEDQIFPLTTWGKHYLAAQTPPGRMGEPNFFRVISGAKDNLITFGGLTMMPVTLNSGEWVEFMVNGAFEANSTDRMLVVQYMVGENYFGVFNGVQDGDPSLGLVVPKEQYRTSYDFLTPETYTSSYVTVIAELGTSFTLDATVEMMGFDNEVGASGFGHKTIKVDPGPHHITSDKPFGISVSGRASFTSYLFPGGLNLNELDPG